MDTTTEGDVWRSSEDLDLLKRSTKKSRVEVKSLIMDMDEEATIHNLPISKEQVGSLIQEKALPTVSFKDTLMGLVNSIEFETLSMDDYISNGHEISIDEDETECPTIPLTQVKKMMYCQPWRQTLIHKVMG